MDTTQLRQILAEQQEELDILAKSEMLDRSVVGEVNINSNLAQIITGIRRCGKSTLAWMALKGQKFAYVNFDDERLIDFNTNDLNQLLETLYIVYGEFEHLLLDEIQNIEYWHLFVNRLLRKRIKIVLTGSNSNLLSQEMASHLTGRYSITELFPYSFSEFLLAGNSKLENLETARARGLALNKLMEYMRLGGFPEVVYGENKKQYVSNLFDAIVSRDIIYRYNIRHPRTFREIAYWLTGNFAAEMSYNRIKNIFGLGSENTAKNYISYLEEAWLFVSLSKFSYKKHESLRNRKMYLIDLSFAQLAGEGSGRNEGRLLENLVFLQLLRNRTSNGYEIYYYKANVEVDFVIYKLGYVKELIQVSLSLEDEKTKKREIRALLTASKNLKAKKLTIITLNSQEVMEIESLTINVVSVLDWILGEVGEGGVTQR